VLSRSQADKGVLFCDQCSWKQTVIAEQFTCLHEVAMPTGHCVASGMAPPFIGERNPSSLRSIRRWRLKAPQSRSLSRREITMTVLDLDTPTVVDEPH